MTNTERRDATSDLAFQVWQDMQSADFYVLMAHKHGSADDLAKGRDKLASAIARIDAAQAQTQEAA